MDHCWNVGLRVESTAVLLSIMARRADIEPGLADQSMLHGAPGMGSPRPMTGFTAHARQLRRDLRWMLGATQLPRTGGVTGPAVEIHLAVDLDQG